VRVEDKAPVRRRKRGARFADIAAEAGVSEATVDRVLNERGSVSAASRERVVAAALKLGVPRILPDIRHGILHLDVILPVNDTPMFKRLDRALQRAIQMLDRRIVVHRITLDHRNDAAFAQSILHPPYRRSGLIVVGSRSPRTMAALHDVIATGEPVVTMVSNLPDVPVAYYAGIDNFVAGRTAGHAIGQITRGEGRVLVLRGLESYPAHEERVNGCLDALREFFPEQPSVVAATETNDDPDICYRLVCDALRRERIAAVYNSGDGSAGVHEALQRFGVSSKVVWVGHEMQDEHSRFLTDGSMDLVIDQNPDGQVLSALQYLLFACGQIDQPPAEHEVELSLFTLPNARRTPYLGAT